MNAGRRSPPITNPAKELWPDEFTKGDLIEYYRGVAKWMLPHLAGRPLTLERFPNGIDRPSFFEKEAPRGVPEWVHRETIASHGGRDETHFLVCDDEATLVYIANLAAIVLHVWTSRVPGLDRPEYVLFDLDPFDGCTIATLARVALALRDMLTGIGLRPLVKTTGGSGLHVVVPLELVHTYDEAKLFAEIVATRMHAVIPRETTMERKIAKRAYGTVYLDWVQVGKGKTMVAPFSVRARPGAPVSMPVEWSEVDALTRRRTRDTAAALGQYTMRNAIGVLKREGDRWAPKFWKPQRLDSAISKARKTWR